MRQHMSCIGKKTTTNEHGYKSTVKHYHYQAVCCQECPLKCLCTKAKGSRIVEANFHLMTYKAKARELLLSEEDIKHRKRRPIEPETVFGQMKFDMAYKRFRHKGFDKVQMDFAVFAMAFNLKKLCAKLAKAAHNNILRLRTVIKT